MERDEGQTGNSVSQSPMWEDISKLRWVKVKGGWFASQNVPRKYSMLGLSTFLKVCLMRRVREKSSGRHWHLRKCNEDFCWLSLAPYLEVWFCIIESRFVKLLHRDTPGTSSAAGNSLTGTTMEAKAKVSHTKHALFLLCETEEEL